MLPDCGLLATLWSFIVGGDLNTDNTTLGSAKRAIMGGVQFDFEAPYKGFLNIAVMAYKEWQHDGFASTFPFQPIPNPSGEVDFDPTWAVEAKFYQPLGFLPPWLPLKYKALVVMHRPKGCGEPCQPLGPGSYGRPNTSLNSFSSSTWAKRCGICLNALRSSEGIAGGKTSSASALTSRMDSSLAPPRARGWRRQH